MNCVETLETIKGYLDSGLDSETKIVAIKTILRVYKGKRGEK